MTKLPHFQLAACRRLEGEYEVEDGTIRFLSTSMGEEVCPTTDEAIRPSKGSSPTA
jgi:hypothetical protein